MPKAADPHDADPSLEKLVESFLEHLDEVKRRVEALERALGLARGDVPVAGDQNG